MMNINIDSVHNYSNIRRNLVIKLVNTANVPTNNVLCVDITEDIVATFYIKLAEDDENRALTPVTESLMEEWGKTGMEVYADAKYNLEDDYELVSLAKLLSKKMGIPEEAFAPISDTMFTLSNKRGVNGASCILNDNIMRYAREQIGDFIILPSSVHEVILLKADKDCDPDAVNEIIRTINETEVAPKDILSDKAYKYDYARQMIVKL